MKKSHIEHIKTGLLVLLVFCSFLFSGFLWYSTPSTETLIPDKDVPPYVFKGPLYNHKEKHELIAPYQIIIHKGNRTFQALPDESEAYKEILHTSHQLEFHHLEEIFPLNTNWATVFYESEGWELCFRHNASHQFMESFFGKTIPYHGGQKPLNNINRIWIFTDKVTKRLRIWAISDEERRVAEAHTQTPNAQIEKRISLHNKEWTRVTPTSLTGPLPWDVNGKPFTKYFYFPTSSFTIEQLTFQTENMNIDNMKQWLFRDPEIKPLLPNPNEYIYMYNDQLLSFNSYYNYMIYNDTSSVQSNKKISLSIRLDQMKTFIQRHQGWTGTYLLDKIQQKDLLFFRLFKQGYPVFWLSTPSTQQIYPDLIQLQTGDNGVSKYIRSMYYLARSPIKKTSTKMLPKEELINRIQQKGIPLYLVDRVFPGYITKEHVTQKNKKVLLTPVWIVQKTNGKQEFIS